MESASKAGVSFESAPSLRTLHQSVVTVKVGPELHPFVIHKERLCHYSSYFKAALTGSFVESAKSIVELSDQDVKIFEFVEHWLYTQKLPKDVTEAATPACSDLIKIYVLADRFGMPSLQNAVVDVLVHPDTNLPTPADIEYVYNNTPSESPLRRLLVAIVAFDSKPEWIPEDLRFFPNEFIFQIASLNAERLPRRLPGEVAPYEKDICQYHEHSNSANICAAKQNKVQKRKLDGVL